MSYMKGERFSWPSSCMHVYTEMHSEIVRSKYASHLQSSTSRVWICIAEHAGECDRRRNLLQRWCDSCTQLCTGCPGGCRQALPSRHCPAGTAWHKHWCREPRAPCSLTVLSCANCARAISVTPMTITSTCVLRSAQGQTSTILCKGKQNVDRWTAQIHTVCQQQSWE